MASSSAEAEYRAMAKAMELVWMELLLGELGFQISAPMELYCDNQEAIHVANNPVFHERTIYIELDCHYIRDKVKENITSLQHVKSKVQLFQALIIKNCSPNYVSQLSLHSFRGNFEG